MKDAEKQVRCSHGHSHTVIEQSDSNTCGSKALRQALIEMGKGDSCPDADQILGYVGIARGKGGWTGKQLGDAFGLVSSVHLNDACSLQSIGKGNAFGLELRAGDLQASPVIAYCHAFRNGSAAGGHWVAIVRRNKRFGRTSSFCVLDSATGTVQDVIISKDTGVGQFSFTDKKKGDRWVLRIDGGYRIR